MVECGQLSAHHDVARFAAHDHWEASAAIAEGATATAYQPGVGAAFAVRAPDATFSSGAPDTYLYDGVAPSARLVGLEWNVTASTAPEGFPGANDVWVETASGVWTLRAWILRPFDHQAEPFATTHPCLRAAGAVYDTTDPCYTATHPRLMEIVVTNDDG